MASVKEHLRKFHEQQAAHHVVMAKAHRQVAKCFGSMGKAAEGMESAEDISDAHEGMAQQHIEMGEFHLQCCKSLDTTHKAVFVGGMDRDDLVPDHVFGYLPEIPLHIRAVPRAGQREIGSAHTEIPAGLEKVLGED